MRHSLKVGIDIDGTLSCQSTVLSHMADYYRKPIGNIEDILDFNISSIYNISEDEANTFWETKEMDLCIDAKFHTKRAESIYKRFINEKHDEVYVITSRGEQYRKVTEDWLKKNDVKYKELVMTNGESKVDILRELKIDIMIDDKPELFYEVKEAGLHTFMVCVDYKYNKDVPCDIRMSLEGELY